MHACSLQPSEFYLSQNYPNPFRGTTAIKFCVAFKTKVKLDVTDLEGKAISTILDEEKETGTYEVEIDASIFPAGGIGRSEDIYVYTLQAADFSATKRMLLLRQKALS